MRKKVIIFSDNNTGGLQRQINIWLEKNPTISIVFMLQTESMCGDTINGTNFNVTVTIYYHEA